MIACGEDMMIACAEGSMLRDLQARVRKGAE
jgi:hypothetical protein